MANRRRDDPKGFNYRAAFGGALAAIAGFALVKKLLPRVAAKYRNPQDYVSEVPAGSRPIEGVGTNVAAGRTTGKAKKPRSSGRPASRRGARKKRGGGTKRR